jgi:chemotaxis protein methyltransferase CheR
MPLPLNQTEFTNFSQLIFNYAGIHMDERKKPLIEGRLRKRLIALNLETYHDYFTIVKSNHNPSEKQLFIDLLTTNETWFFREEKHFDFISQLMAKSKSYNQVEFWSAACSSGQEPYSIAMLMAELRNLSQPWNILATDISKTILTKAKEGIYLKDRVKGLSLTRQKTFMLKELSTQVDYLSIRPELKEKIEFRAFNLINSPLPNKKFDIIFCRNVLIYFELKQKKIILNRLKSCLKSDGYIITGHSESLHGICDELTPVQPSIYRKK